MARFSIIETPQNMPFFDGVVGVGGARIKVFPGSGSNGVNPDFTPPGSRVAVKNITGVFTPPGSGFNFLPGFYPRRGRGRIFCSGF